MGYSEEEQLKRLNESLSTLHVTVKETVERKSKEIEEKFNSRISKIEEKNDSIEAKAGTSFGAYRQPGAPLEIKSIIGDALRENADGISQLYEGKTKRLYIETKAVGDMSLTANLTGGTSSISSPMMGPVGMTYRLNNVRDFLRHNRMTGMYVPLLKDNGGEGAAAPVAESGTKPQVDFDLAEANAKAEVIAATAIISKQFLEDVQNAQGWLTDRLTELYNTAENDQLLNGTGVSPQLSGLNTAGNFTAATGLATVNVEQIIQGLLQLRSMKRRGTAIIIHPDNLESLVLNKSAGSGEYDLPGFVTVSPQTGQLMIMGVPVIDVSEQPTGTFTIHDNTGSQYTVRQGITIELFDQPYATTNKILVRIEARIAFPIFGATYTVKGTF